VTANVGVLLEAMGEPTRRVLVERLAQGPAAVGQLAGDLPITRSAVSQHLKILKAVGLVTDQAVGTRRVYSVDPAALAIIRDYFDAFWTRSLAASADAAAQQEDP